MVRVVVIVGNWIWNDLARVHSVGWDPARFKQGKYKNVWKNPAYEHSIDTNHDDLDGTTDTWQPIDAYY